MTDATTQTVRRTLQGRVVSDRMQKTITVLIERKVKHPVIGKIMTRSKKYHAHSEGFEAVTGDLVQIEECAPISKTKAWRVAKILEKARVV
ncbi:MAG: 30S ribosomal protein S17 [Sterolibacteriaceae bacterium]|jgi:small subunit ribosomal protein S17|uniref:30S ribosomal protein S17 n=1 Tax=Sulfuritalea sp. TaxID=2480090 RepID=UPI001A3EF81E|nr:30S ribosomal protein S17 [Sulfuritalea sp.]MBL8480350.1 30S ribosomal protein S17 [Sterolibacteriaceae bacterium]MBN8474105.1 30S ribosomal protein S17 [Sulfuritalea sp.]